MRGNGEATLAHPRPRCPYIRIPACAHVRCSGGGSPRAVTDRPNDRCRQTISLSFDSRGNREDQRSPFHPKGNPYIPGRPCPLYCSANHPAQLAREIDFEPRIVSPIVRSGRCLQLQRNRTFPNFHEMSNLPLLSQHVRFRKRRYFRREEFDVWQRKVG